MVYRIELESSENEAAAWALKAGAITTPRERMIQVAGIVHAASRNCELLAPPLIRCDSDCSLVSKFGFHWELARWVPGQPLTADACNEEIAVGAEAIARVHAAISSLGQPKLTSGSTPRCISSRVERLRQLTPQIETLARRALTPEKLSPMLAAQLTAESEHDLASQFRCRHLAHSLIEATNLLAECWTKRTPPLLARLVQQGQLPHVFPIQWTLRDVHREHVLFGPLGRVNGVIDYDAIDQDSPAADVARWAGDFAKQTEISTTLTSDRSVADLLSAAVAGYRRIRPFSDDEYELAKTLIEASSLGGLGNWLVWLILENRQFDASADRIRGRITHLIASICRIC
jgi:Ser/Thr protein kinase RdoA (MazF antagonist)